MERKEGKVDCKGSYREYMELMEERGSFVKEKEKLSDEELSKFGHYKGYIGKHVDDIEGNIVFKEDSEKLQNKTEIIIEDCGYTKEEINEAIFKAYRYLEKLARKDSEKTFVVYKNTPSK
ncbi:MAG: hypothetical protein ACLRPU_00080 [Enterococcus hulanensis]